MATIEASGPTTDEANNNNEAVEGNATGLKVGARKMNLKTKFL